MGICASGLPVGSRGTVHHRLSGDALEICAASRSGCFVWFGGPVLGIGLGYLAGALGYTFFFLFLLSSPYLSSSSQSPVVPVLVFIFMLPLLFDCAGS